LIEFTSANSLVQHYPEASVHYIIAYDRASILGGWGSRPPDFGLEGLWMGCEILFLYVNTLSCTANTFESGDF